MLLFIITIMIILSIIAIAVTEQARENDIEKVENDRSDTYEDIPERQTKR